MLILETYCWFVMNTQAIIVAIMVSIVAIVILLYLFIILIILGLLRLPSCCLPWQAILVTDEGTGLQAIELPKPIPSRHPDEKLRLGLKHWLFWF